VTDEHTVTDSHASEHATEHAIERAASQARADWDRRIGLRRGRQEAGDAALRPSVAAPRGLRATPGRGQVTLDWEPVEGALGYLVHSAAAPEGPFTPIDETGRDVLAVPHPPYVAVTDGLSGADGSAAEGRPAGEGGLTWYAVAAVADMAATGELSEPIAGGLSEPVAAPSPTAEEAKERPTAEEAAVSIRVAADRVVRPLPRPWRPIIGSEHLSHMLCTDRSGGRAIGAELAEALRICRDELGVQTVRAHGILCDDLGVYREVEGEPLHDFSGVDRVYDRLMELGLRPVVELSFMPRDLAAEPDKTVFAYRAIISPPRDWGRWAGLVRALVAHLVERYGLDEVRERWSFEVWNEANLEVFWSGTREDYLRLYEETARAIRSVDPRLRVGGPASAAVGWIGELLEYADAGGSPAGAGHGTAATPDGSGTEHAPVDFVSTHTYGSPPLDLRPVLARHGRAGTPIWWTEWGVSPQHFDNVSDGPFAAAFLARGMRSAAGRIEALGYWVASDHFEELGRPERLLHGGFGLLTVGNLRKPRFWALAMLERLGADEVAAELSGDGAGGLVEAWPTRDAGGRVAVAVWNGVLDQSKADGCAALDRRVRLRVGGLGAGPYELRHYRLDRAHSNIAAVWERMSHGADWPDDAGWRALREADRLESLEPARAVSPVGGTIETTFDLPMPAVSLIELVPR
jgi:xylan 1,4-beta-xylosidase